MSKLATATLSARVRRLHSGLAGARVSTRVARQLTAPVGRASDARRHRTARPDHAAPAPASARRRE